LNITGGGGISANDVLILLFGADFSGASTASGAGIKYMDAHSNTEVT